jgi:hypothetical protein
MRLFCILNPKIGATLILESVWHDLRRSFHANVSLHTGQFTYPVAQVLNPFLISIEDEFAINGYVFACGSYDSLSLATKMLAAAHVPEELLELFVTQTPRLELFDTATHTIMNTQNAPEGLVDAYQAHCCIRPIAIRVQTPIIYNNVVIADTPPNIPARVLRQVSTVEEDDWFPSKRNRRRSRRAKN